MKFQTCIILSANAAFISSAPVDSAYAVPSIAPTGTTIGTVISAGTGCQSGSGTAIVDAGLSTFNLSTPNLKTSTTDSGALRKTCQFIIPITYPSGYQYAVEEFDVSGHETVPIGSTGTALGSFYFSGESTTKSFTTPLSGPSDANFAGAYAPDPVDLAWSECGKGVNTQALLNAKPEVRVGSSSALGAVSIDKSVIKLVWRAC
jgi:hypothetical protein